MSERSFGKQVESLQRAYFRNVSENAQREQQAMRELGLTGDLYSFNKETRDRVHERMRQLAGGQQDG